MGRSAGSPPQHAVVKSHSCGVPTGNAENGLFGPHPLDNSQDDNPGAMLVEWFLVGQDLERVERGGTVHVGLWQTVHLINRHPHRVYVALLCGMVRREQLWWVITRISGTSVR